MLRILRRAATGAAVVMISGAAAAAAQDLQPEALAQWQAVQREKAARSETERKIDSQLLYELKKRAGDPLFDLLPGFQTGVTPAADDSLLVEIRAQVTPGLQAEILAHGGRELLALPSFDAVRARLPLTAIEDLAAAREVRFIRPWQAPLANKDNTSEGDVAHRAPTARATFGVDGSGIKVGVISDGVDTLAARQATGDLPPTVTILAGQGGSGDEGTAMLEIVYDLASGADLYFATGFAGPAQMAQNILDLRAAGCQVIVDDVTYFGQSVFQDGQIAQSVNTVVAAGAVYFSSAANSGNFNDGTSGVWEGDFVDLFGPGFVPNGFHEFFSSNEGNPFTKDAPSALTLQWSDPAGASGNDYDLAIFDSLGSTLVASSTNVQDGDDDPFEFISTSSGSVVSLQTAIFKNAGAAGRFLHMNSNRGQLFFNTPGSTFGHNAGEMTFSTAATSASNPGGTFVGGATNPVRTFSSDGPRRIFYEPNGTAITPGNFSSTGGRLLQKPDITAADGVMTATPGFNPFDGTSAAAPHAAAIAALMLQESALNRAGMLAVFAATSLDIEAPGVDRDSGVGILDAKRAVGTVTADPCAPAGDCYASVLLLGATPNTGPATFRAEAQITWQSGTFDMVTGLSPLHIFADGFESGDTSSWGH